MKNNNEKIINEYLSAIKKRENWESHWEECLEYTMPNRKGIFDGSAINGAKKNAEIFDSTAVEAVENLASNLMSGIVPSWSKWFSLNIKNKIEFESDAVKKEVYSTLEKIENTVQDNFDLSNFNLEIHQCFLDLVCLGTGCLMFEENQIGETSAFKFKSIPLSQIVIDEGENGLIDKVFRKSKITFNGLKERFNNSLEKFAYLEKYMKNDATVDLIEAVVPRIKSTGKHGYNYNVFIELPEEIKQKKSSEKILVLKDGYLENSPFICFRWVKNTNEVYGRSPVMKALPDIKTVNKVVELILKNATLAISGVWQADDDGVINLDNISLEPGTIITKAVGSNGLSPLKSTSDFNVSQLVLSDLRNSINRAFYVSELGAVNNGDPMSATEASHRIASVSKSLGSVFGRLQNELLMPIIMRSINILKRRGEIENITINSSNLSVRFQSPLANIQAKYDAENMLTWVKYISNLGADSIANINVKEVSLTLGRALGISENLMNNTDIKNSIDSLKNPAEIEKTTIQEVENV